MILGVQWLETLGTVLTNWKTQVMQYEVEGRTVILVGDPSLVHARISLKAMLKTLRKTGGGFRVELNSVEAGVHQLQKEVVDQSVPAFLREVVDKNQAVFKENIGLPPLRGHEHHIVLKEGANPVGCLLYTSPSPRDRG